MNYLLLAVLMAFFPAEAIMPFAGFSAYRDSISIVGVIIAGTVGSTFGSVVIYLLCRSLNEAKIERSLARYGNWVGLNEQNISHAGRWFDQHAASAIVIGRLIPGFRTAVSVPAGLRAMPFVSFIGFTTLGTTIWVAVLALIGYQLHSASQEQISSAVTTITSATCVIVVLFIGVAATWRKFGQK